MLNEKQTYKTTTTTTKETCWIRTVNKSEMERICGLCFLRKLMMILHYDMNTVTWQPKQLCAQRHSFIVPQAICTYVFLY
jgi:hypothetical protein